MDLTKIYALTDSRAGEFLTQLREFLRQPSVSPQNIGVADCAHLLMQYLKNLGCQEARVVPTAGHPVVYARLNAGAKKTLIAYMMYDTQPFDEPGWTHPPMEAQLVEMKRPDGSVKAIVNRGAFNSKGPLLSFLHAVRAIRESQEKMPVNLLFVAEGEEELGSPHLPDFIDQFKKELSQADACFFPFFTQDHYGKARFFLGNKGIVYLELECSGKAWGRGPQEFDIHSSNKAWMDSPVWRLIHALASMTDETGNKIRIKGFYDDVRPPTVREKKQIEALAKTFNPRAIKEANQVGRFAYDEKDKRRLITEYLYGTTLNIDGIWGGYIGPGTKTVLPHQVTAKLDIRLVPEQRAETVLKLLRKHLSHHGYRDIEIRLLDAYGWAQTDPDAPVVQAALRAARAFGVEPEVWPRIGGSAPFYLFSEVLKIPFMMGIVGHGARAHSPDEYIVWEGNGKVLGYLDAVKSMVCFLDEYSRA